VTRKVLGMDLARGAARVGSFRVPPGSLKEVLVVSVTTYYWPLASGELSPGHKRLEQRLLGMGGREVVFAHDPHFAALLRRGAEFPVKGRRFSGGIDEHFRRANVAMDYLGSRHLKIVTGYGLDGETWRQHSWLWNGKSGRVVEEWGAPDRYFGVVLNEAQTRRFLFMTIVELTPEGL
jgi:hypothetical protein